ncbi:MAG: hypothetical protein KC502_08080 [Myxococcales bacterium]|nr:hypothetical protein [Myxococcales bacterium]
MKQLAGILIGLLIVLGGCVVNPVPTPGNTGTGGGVTDAGATASDTSAGTDAGASDAGVDAGTQDASESDTISGDAGAEDGAGDAGAEDGADSDLDGLEVDGGQLDAG